MTYELIIKRKAECDMQDCLEWYEGQKKGLGKRFIDAVDLSMNSILTNPLKHQIKYKSVRMALVRPFRIAIYYIVNEHRVIVLAVLSTHRNPKLWEDRT